LAFDQNQQCIDYLVCQQTVPHHRTVTQRRQPTRQPATSDQDIRGVVSRDCLKVRLKNINTLIIALLENIYSTAKNIENVEKHFQPIELNKTENKFTY